MLKDNLHVISGLKHKSRFDVNDSKKQFLLIGRFRINIFGAYLSKHQCNQ